MKKLIAGLIGLVFAGGVHAVDVNTYNISDNTTLSGTTLTLTGATTEPSRIASWQFTSWNPSDIAGAETAPSSSAAASMTAASYMVITAATDTTTVTFSKAGKYRCNIQLYVVNTVAAPTLQYLRVILGGTATRYWTPTGHYFILTNASTTYADSRSLETIVSATAAQTITYRPFYAVTIGGGTNTNYTASGAITCGYLGST